MSGPAPAKIVARNVAAVRRFIDPQRITEVIAGNPAATRLESGVGNCFPGLECDLRNLERRFFPFLQVETLGNFLVVAAVDTAGVDQARAAGQLDAADAAIYQTLADDLTADRLILVMRMAGSFGPLGNKAFNLAMVAMEGEPETQGDLTGISDGTQRLPSDAWTAIRMLTEDSEVTLTFRRQGSDTRTLTARRARYLDDNGALAAAFLPGELTQSLCSPWTHDFRDCGCFYWASNHPDIAQPARSNGVDAPGWDRDVPWQRPERTIGIEPPPPATPATPNELEHYEINNRWQELHFVLGRREIVTPYVPGLKEQAKPLPDLATLVEHLRYAAGVELAVLQEYLCAAYSLKSSTDPSVAANEELRNDIRASRAEIIRIAVGEMRHLRAVNDSIRGLSIPGAFEPALRVATRIPGVAGQMRDVTMQAATRTAIQQFIAIEAPSGSVDGLYSRILATLETPPADVAPLATDEWREAVRSVIAEGEDHYRTFLDIQEWLAGHPESDYLRSTTLTPPPANNQAHQQLQAAYAEVLRGLRKGYRKGRFLGAPEINSARTSMVAPAGVSALAETVAAQGFLVVFDAPTEPDFTPLAPPAGF